MSATHTNKQKVWPLFLLAAALVAFGFWFVFAFPVTNPVAPTSLPEPFLEQAPMPAAEEDFEDSVQLEYGAADRSFSLDLRQRRVSNGNAVRSRVAMGVVDSVEEVGPPTTWRREYEEAIVQVGDDAIIGREISQEVERLLENSAHELVADPSGEAQAYRLVSSESAQLRQTLAMVRQALAVLLPRFPREPVRSGEEWSWEVPIRAAPRDEGSSSSVRGNIEFTARVFGTEPRGIVIELEFESASEGLIVTDEERHEFVTSGKGKGRVVWSPPTQRVVESIATQTESLSHGGRTVETTHSLRLLAE